MELLKGIPVAPGVVVARAFVLDHSLERVALERISEGSVDHELTRLDEVFKRVQRDIQVDRDRAAEQLGPEPAKIFEFHLALLRDPLITSPIRERIREEKVTAEYAVATGFREVADRFRKMSAEVLRQKANDLLDIERRMLGHLLGRTRDRLANVAEPVVIVAYDITPAQAAGLDTQWVRGVAVDAGGRTSHSAIVASALGIPVVVGLQRLTGIIHDGDPIVIDGRTGVVVVRPNEETVRRFERSMARSAAQQRGMLALSEHPSVTTDGHRVRLMGNIEFAREIPELVARGGEGVGLFRTEFLYLTRDAPPSEEEQFEEYRRCAELLEGRPLTIRTFDLGADKYTQERALDPERNPMLGLRSIRFCLQNIPLFRTQLRAILRASAFGPIRVMFPLVSIVMELRQARMILGDVMEELEDEGVAFDRTVAVGMMVEVPSAALLATSFAREVSFFSIGTNDLIQYTLAVDRGNERVANLYSGASPAVLQLIKAVIRAGRRFNVDTSLCGELASEPLFTMLLLGLGLRTLSLSPSRIPTVKRVIRAVDMERCERLARRVGSFDSERQILRVLREELEQVIPDLDEDWSEDPAPAPAAGAGGDGNGPQTGRAASDGINSPDL